MPSSLGVATTPFESPRSKRGINELNKEWDKNLIQFTGYEVLGELTERTDRRTYRRSGRRMNGRINITEGRTGVAQC